MGYLFELVLVLTTCLDGRVVRWVGVFGGMEIKTKPIPSLDEVGVGAELGNTRHQPSQTIETS